MPKHEIDYRTIMLPVEAKLRGSRARRLGEDLETLFADGYDQVVLDLRACASLDSVGALSLLRALDLGVRLYLVIGPGLRGADLLPPELETDPRLKIFGDPADAIRHARSHDESGVLVP